MDKIVRFSENLEKFAASRTSELNDRGKFFSLVQPVAFWQQANNTIPQKLNLSLGPLNLKPLIETAL